jgi:putative endonuclease
MNIFYVYILELTSKNGKKSFYTGYTNNLLRRLGEHKKGNGAKYVRGKKCEIKYFETHLDRATAMKRELQIKSYSKQQKRDLIKKISEMQV